MGDTLPPAALGPGLPQPEAAPAHNMFDDIDPQAGAPPPPREPNMFDDMPDTAAGETGATGTFISHAARGVLPALGGMAGAGAGAEAGAAIGGGIGAIGGPLGAAGGAAVGGFVGGLAGFFGGSALTETAQDWGVRQLPMSVQEATGQSERAQREQEIQHPYASFLGGIAPYAITMSPGGWTKAAASLPENATAFQRIMANPITQKVFSGAVMGGMELGNEWTDGQPTDWAKVGISTGFGLVFSHANRFGEYITELGARPVQRVFAPRLEVPPAGVLNPAEPTIAQAGDVGVMGPGITESTFLGGEQQSPETRATAQNAAADEQTALGALPTPDLDAIARRLAPETFAQNDTLLAQRDALRSWIATESNPSDDMMADAQGRRDALDQQLAETKNRAEQRRLRVQQRAAQAELDDLTARRQAWEAGTHVDTPDISLARQHLQDTEHALWDLGPEISAARRRAADHVGEPEAGQETTPTPQETTPTDIIPTKADTIAAKAVPETPTAPEPKSPEAQRAFIAQDRATQLMAAGLSRETAEASAHVEAAYYTTLAARFGGALGTAEDLYRQRAARVAVPGAAAPEEPPPITRAEPLTPPAIRSLADIQDQEKVSANKAKKIQDAEILARGRVITPGEPRAEPTVRAPEPAPVQPTAVEPVAPAEAREPEPAEVAQAPAAPAPRPRLRSAADIMREDRVPESKVKAIQDAELAALAEWQAANPSGEPRPKRNRAVDTLAETVGVPAAGVPTPDVIAEIVDRLPEERVVEEVNAAAEAGEIEYREAETEAKEVARPAPSEAEQARYADRLDRINTSLRLIESARERMERNARKGAVGNISLVEQSRQAIRDYTETLMRDREGLRPEDRAALDKLMGRAEEAPPLSAITSEVRPPTTPAAETPKERTEIAEVVTAFRHGGRSEADQVLERILKEKNLPLDEQLALVREIHEVVPEMAAWDPSTFYDADQSRPLEELESEHRPANEAAAPEQREGGGGEPITPAGDEGQVPEGGGPVWVVGGVGGRAPEEGGEPGDVEHAVAAAGAGPTYEPEPAGAVTGGAAGAEGQPAAEPVGVRRTDARGNPIFAKGERVVIPDGEHLAGRHGTVETASGLVFQSIYGGEKSAPTYSYEVRTDAGELVHSIAPIAETGERPEVVPDPIYQGHPINPAELVRRAGLDDRAATGYIARGARARTPKMKAEWAREAAASRAKAAAQRAVLDAWAAEHPEEAAKVLPQKTPAAAKAPEAEAPIAGMSIVETRHTKHGYPLWSVTLSGERLAADRFNELRDAAKEGGGNWSSWRGHGAVPGFQFRTRDAAEAFRERFGGGGPAAGVPAPATSARPEWTEAGQNDRGETIYVNAEGAHSVIENGVRVVEGVALRPVRDERTGRISYVPQIKAPGSKELRYEVVPEVPTAAEVTEQAGGSESLPPQPAPAPETPKARTVSDALAPAEGKGPLPVTSAPPAEPLDADMAGLQQMLTPETPEQRAARQTADAARAEQVARDREAIDARMKARAAGEVPAAEYGANNKLVTQTDREAIRARLRAKAGQLRTGIDPEMMLDGARLAVFHIEAGARAFADYAREMIADIGDEFRPYLRSWYEAARHWPDVDARGMTEAGEIEELPRVEPAEPEEGYRDYAEQLYDARRTDPVVRDIAQRLADGETPEEIANGPVGDHFTVAEIAGLARVMEREGEIPEPTEPEEEEGGHPVPVPAGDEGPSAEDVHGTPAVGQVGPVPAGEGPGGEPTAGAIAGEAPEEQRGEAQPSGQTGGRGNRPGATDRVPGAGEGSAAGATGRFADRPDAGVEGTNFSIEPGDLAEGRGRKQKARDNLAAISLAKRLAEEDRPATRAEQAILVKYTGWGGLKGAFEGSDRKFGKGYEDIGARLKEALTPEEYRTAAQSTQYAHYTAEHVVRSMWDAVRRMGFESGTVFEPGMGIGHFLGLMPPDLAEKAQYQGIERDHLTAQIAKLLYPESGVRQADYTRMPMPEDYFDLVIGNPPFGNIKIQADPKYAARGFSLHDYFFAKSLDSVRPGGLLAFITSAHTMNNLGADARNYLADRAEFVGGIRMPSSTFEQNAGTEVTTDILFLRKRAEGEAPGSREWTETVQRTLPSDKFGPTETQVSRYFTDHPENVLGKEVWGESQAAGDYAVEQRPDTDLAADLRYTVQQLPADVMTASPSPEDRAKLDFSSGQHKDGSFYIGPDGRLMKYENGGGTEVSKRGGGVKGGLTTQEREQVRHLVPVRDALRDVFAADLADDAEAGVLARAKLNEQYDAFVAKFGPINKAEFTYRRPTPNQIEEARLEAREEARYVGDPWNDGDFDPSEMLARKAKITEIAKAREAARQEAIAGGRKFDEGSFDPEEVPDRVQEKLLNVKAFMSDPESYRLRSIEEYNKRTGEGTKKEIFTKNILKREKEPELKSANDGVLWSMNSLGRFDVDAIAKKMDRTAADIVAELGDSVYKVPGTRDSYQTKDEYLSGDIVSKLETARAESETDPDVRRNIPALEAALPPPLPPSEISMLLGMPWIPIDTVRQFVSEHLNLGEPPILHSPLTGTWIVHGEGWGGTPGAPQWGIGERDAFELLADTMNRTPPRIYQWEGQGSERRRVFDAVATQAAQDKVDAIKAAFTEWIGADTERADGLAQVYNDNLNRTVLRQYDGSYMTTPGVASYWQWRPHQTRVVARIVQDGNTYMAHAVGAGKTSAMIGAGMEMRRLGLVRKPMYVVPNHMLGQFTKEFYEQYPTARIAVADEDRFHTDKRRQFVSNVSQDDLDAVIITHSSFGKIPISDGFQKHLIDEQIEMLDEAIAELQGPEARFTRGRIENQKEKLQQKLSKQGASDQDQTLTFEEMGADFLFVDEAHMFRKLSFGTKQGNMKGISPEGSDMAWDLYTKVRYLDSKKPGRSVVFASGTPVTNTMGELYSLSRYMQPEALEKRGIAHFDSWAQTFGDTKTGLEETAAGTYQPVTRFGQFVNLPELYKMVGERMDIVTPSQLEQYVTRPSLQTGGRQFHLAPRTEALDRYQAELAGRMEAIKNRTGKVEKGDDILLSVINDGRHAAIDPRFVEDAQSDPRSKLNMMIQNVVRIHRDTADHQFYDPNANYQKESFRGPATQMIFANLGINGRGPMGFSSYQWIKESLRREGIPANEIAFIGDYKSAIQRQALFNDMNEGKVRILIGSTQKMGTGVNAQKRLYALHNLDPLWYPADDEQRVGRILRQGNNNASIEVHDYSTKGTYDSAMWKMMGNKGRFIEQFFRGDPNLRNMEDVGEASMYEQASAMATTDERIITLTQMKQDLDKARRQQSAHDREQYSLRSKVKNHEWNAGYYARRMEALREDIATREDLSGDKFSATVGGKKYDKRADAAKAMALETAERADDLGKGADTVIGRIGGFSIIMAKSKDGDLMFGMRRSGGELSELNATWFGGKAQHEAFAKDYEKMAEDQKKQYSPPAERRMGAPGVIQSAEHMLGQFEKWLQDAELTRAQNLRSAESIRPLIGAEFTGGPEIQRLTRAVNDLEGQLRKEAAAKEKGPGAPPQQEPEAELPTAATEAQPAPEAMSGRMAGGDLYQRLRQSIQGKIRIAPGDVRSIITLARTADASTFLHESAHDWLKQLLQDAGHALAPDALRNDAATVRRWLKRGDNWTGFKPDGSPDVAPQERFARAFEQYLREGHAPSKALDGVFAQFKAWLTTIYRTLRGLGAPISDDIRGVFDRMLAIEPRARTAGEVPERGPSLAAIHEADAAETQPAEAGAVADRIANERAQNQPPPEVANEVAAAQPEPTGTAEPGAENAGGAAGRGEIPGAGGQSEPVAPGGGVGAGSGTERTGRGGAAAEGPGVGGGTEQPSAAGGRGGAERDPRIGPLAPGPAESFAESEPGLVDLAGNIRVENLTDVESIGQAIHDSADRNADFTAVRGGMTKGQMLDLAEAMGLDPNRIDEVGLARLLGGTAELGPRILAARRLVVQSAEIVSNLMKVAAENWTDEDGGRLAVAIARHDMIQSALAGVTAEWGRAGNAFHNLMAGWGKAQDVNDLLKQNTGRDLYQLRMIAKMGSRLDTPGKVSKYLRDARARSFGGMVLEYWINGLISGIATHTTYMVGNTILAAEKAGPETAAAAAIGAFRARMGRMGTRVRLGEVGQQFRGAIREAPAALQATTEAYRTGVTTQLPGEAARPVLPFQGDTGLVMGRGMTNAPVTWREALGDAYGLVQGMRDGIVATGELVAAGGVEGAPTWGWQYSPLGQIPGLAYKGVEIAPLGHLARFPSRNVAAIHSAFRAMNYSMEINALAYRKAVEEGLSGSALAARTAELRQNPPEEMMNAAVGKATDLTLMGQGGRLTQNLSTFFNKTYNLPVLGETAVLKFVDPFVHIAGNIMNQALLQRTPLGLLSTEIRADLAGKNGNIAQDTAAAKMLVGTALAVTFGGLAAQGLVTGSGPADPNRAAMWRLAGNQAYSVRIGDMWYGMHRLGPMGLLAGVSADLYDLVHQIGNQDASVAGTSLIHAFTQNILDESFMRGPADMIKAVTESDRYGPAYVRNMLGSFLPYSVAMAQMARATDPYSRQARTIMDAIRARVPGMSESLFPRRDIWGDPMPSGDALFAPGVTAIYEQKISTDPVNLAMLALNVQPAPVERMIRNVHLTDQEYDDYARLAGRAAKIRLDAITRSPQFRDWAPSTRHEVFEETIKQARESARGLMMMKYPHIPRDAAKAQIERKTGETVH